MTATIVLITLNIFCFSALFALSEVTRQKIDSANRELKKFTGIADEIKSNPAKVRRDLRTTMLEVDEHLAQATPHASLGRCAGCPGLSRCGLNGGFNCPYSGPQGGPFFDDDLFEPDSPFNGDGE